MRCHRDRGRVSLALAMLAIQLSCGGGYDPAVLEATELCGDGHVDKGELCDTGIPAGQPGACPKECPVGERCAPRMLLGSGCRRQCAEITITALSNGDGCCPAGASARDDSDCGKCGDGILGPGESCDPPSSCPTQQSCKTQQECLTGTFTGNPANCTARCELTVITECRSEDACCPASCTAEMDAECSSMCGNGVVDRMAGETCEPGLRDAPCPAVCDDGDPCTTDLMTGSSSNCNARCTIAPIVQPKNGDRCCPPGASALNDDDCKPTCGNGVAEAGEECDGGDLCTAQCRVLTRDQRQCFDLPTMATDACKECSCLKCAGAMLGCYQSGNATRDKLCTTVMDCADMSHCGVVDCFCGTSAECTAPDGPCRTQISDAANSVFRNQVLACSNNETCPLFWSRSIGECRAMQCAAECGTQPDGGATAPASVR